jgi:hypothetical protein
VDRSALAAARRGKQTATTGSDSLEAWATEARLLIKLERMREAASVATQALRLWPEPDPELAGRLAGLAALTGKVHRAAQLGARTAPLLSNEAETFRGLQVSVIQTWKAFEGYAALGVPAESLRALSARLPRLEAFLPLGDSARIAFQDCAYRYELLSLGFPEIRLPTDRANCLVGRVWLEMQSALERGDPAAARARFADLRGVRRRVLATPGNLALQMVFREAWLIAIAGDTTAAIEHLDATLNALAQTRTSLLDGAAEAAGLVRAMALRAELAAARGERATSQRWARLVTDLWHAADPELGLLGRRMKALAER